MWSEPPRWATSQPVALGASFWKVETLIFTNYPRKYFSSFPSAFPFFYSSLIFFPIPKTLWFFSPTPGGGGIIGEYTKRSTKFQNFLNLGKFLKEFNSGVFINFGEQSKFNNTFFSSPITFHDLLDLTYSFLLSLRYSNNPGTGGIFCAAAPSGTTTIC
jgi:hypothetical protein